jgi:hypothetical protein
MKQQEKTLLNSLSRFDSKTLDDKLLEYATAHVLGQLFYNRMQGAAYGTLKRHGLLGKVNREFRNSLAVAYEQNVIKNRSFATCVDYISQLLAAYPCKVAMLKGAVLCGLYPEGYRTSNDIDLLLHPKDVSFVGKLLQDRGFQQGSIRNGQFVPATRREIIDSKMNRGETVPYIKEVNLPGMKYLEVDLNFSLDYKNGDDTVLNAMLSRCAMQEIGSLRVPALCQEDFFIHLCAHLYKEATTLPWVQMHRDMSLYKYMDIYLLMNRMTQQDAQRLFERAKELGMEQVCAFAILQTAELFVMEDSDALWQAEYILRDNKAFLHQVVSPQEHKIYQYQTEDISERFFMEDRAGDLEEVSFDETS